MNDQDFKFFEALLAKESGLVITPDKVYLLESRLLPVAQRHGVHGLEGIVTKMRLTKDVNLQREVVEAMTTNETSFFRDNTPFQRMKEDLLPIFMKARAGQKILRIWSAACSSGQEPYSLAMMLKEYPLLSDWKVEIVATDLSLDILAQAKSGLYSQFEVQRGLPIQLLVKYFTQQGDKWQVNPALKTMISFKPANLLTDISFLGQFDIVFCRNVLIYFDIPTKAKVLASIKGALRQDGALFLGGAETVIGVSENFRPVPEIKGVYVRSDSTLVVAKKEAVVPPAASSGASSGTKTAAT